MAVEQTHTNPSGGPHTGTAPGGKKKNWVEQHKVLAGLGGAVGLILVLGHKGNKSGGSASAVDPNSAAAAAAAEQAAIDGAVGAATGAANYPSGSGSGGGTGTTDPGTTPVGTGGSTDPTTGATPTTPTGSPNVTINVNNPAPTPQKKATVKPHKAPGANVHRKPPHINPNTGHTSKGAGKKAVPRHPAPRHPAAKTKPPTHKPRGSCIVHGRTFEGATAARTGIPQAAPDGTISTPVIVVYGSHTEAHMSHNNGQGWTDNIPGMTPPSRGVPEMRLATQ